MGPSANFNHRSIEAVACINKYPNSTMDLLLSYYISLKKPLYSRPHPIPRKTFQVVSSGKRAFKDLGLASYGTTSLVNLNSPPRNERRGMAITISRNYLYKTLHDPYRLC